MIRFLNVTGYAILITLAVLIGYKLTESKIAVGVYQNRLENLSKEYGDLRDLYNQAVRRTAVTELIVAERKVSVAIRTADGQQKIIPTPYDPDREIYCDYVLIDGRLWIRRVYDDHTPPRDGILIDPQWDEVNWSDPGARYGNAVYRSLSEGRWVVTVTGDGSLGLAPAETDKSIPLASAPEVREFDEMQKQINTKIDGITIRDVMEQLINRP